MLASPLNVFLRLSPHFQHVNCTCTCFISAVRAQVLESFLAERETGKHTHTEASCLCTQLEATELGFKVGRLRTLTFHCDVYPSCPGKLIFLLESHCLPSPLSWLLSASLSGSTFCPVPGGSALLAGCLPGSLEPYFQLSSAQWDERLGPDTSEFPLPTFCCLPAVPPGRPSPIS